MRPTTGRFAVPSGDLRDQAQHPSAPAGRAARLRWSRRICSSLAAMAAPSPSQATWAMDIRCTSSQASRPRTSVSRRRRDAPPDGALAREVGSPPERRRWKIPSSVGSPSYASWPPGSTRRGGSARVGAGRREPRVREPRQPGPPRPRAGSRPRRSRRNTAPRPSYAWQRRVSAVSAVALRARDRAEQGITYPLLPV
jgi:hypothetical protein